MTQRMTDCANGEHLLSHNSTFLRVRGACAVCKKRFLAGSRMRTCLRCNKHICSQCKNKKGIREDDNLNGHIHEFKSYVVSNNQKNECKKCKKKFLKGSRLRRCELCDSIFCSPCYGMELIHNNPQIGRGRSHSMYSQSSSSSPAPRSPPPPPFLVNRSQSTH
eukprot:UN28826